MAEHIRGEGSPLARSFNGIVSLVEDGVDVGEVNILVVADPVTGLWDGWLLVSPEMCERLIATPQCSVRFPNGAVADVDPLQRDITAGTLLFDGLGPPPPLW